MKTLLPAIALLMALPFPAQAGQDIDLTDENVKFGYSQGYLIGQRFKSNLESDKIDLKAFSQGLKDALTAKSQLTTKQIDEAMNKGPVYLRAAKAEKAKGRTEFLAKNKAKDGVTTTTSGLQYSIIKSGPAEGKNPTAKDTVVVNYAGTLVDGTKFDSSYDRGVPATFGVGQVIPGWGEVLQLMKPGDKWSVVIPPELGYGARGAGRKIGPNEVLLFDVELISIK